MNEYDVTVNGAGTDLMMMVGGTSAYVSKLTYCWLTALFAELYVSEVSLIADR